MDIYLSKRKYNSTFRKKMINKLDLIKEKQDLLEIYNIIIEEIGNNYSSNLNGIFININILSDNCIDKLLNYLENKINNIIILKNMNTNKYKLDNIEILSELGHKLSNQEKNIIKRIKK